MTGLPTRRMACGYRAILALLAVGAMPAAVVAAACLLGGHAAQAHAVAGPRVFVGTLTVDDPGVADEAALPTVTYQRQGAGDAAGPSHNVNISGEFAKRITGNFGMAVHVGYNINRVMGGKTFSGFDNIEVSAKYEVYVNPGHEFMASVGVVREFGGTGAARVGADRFGATTPTVYFGKGLGDLPIGYLRPLAVTGTLGYQIADVRLRSSVGVDPDSGLATVSYNAGNSNYWVGGLTLQYSIPYLQSQVKDLGLPAFFSRLTPLVEIAYASPATRPSAGGTRFTIAPGIVYAGDSYQLAIAALIPGNKATGSNVGVIAQLHLYFDDIFPISLGRPLFGR